MKDVLGLIGFIACLCGLLFVAFVGAFIGGVVGCVFGAVGIPMMILDGKAINPVEMVSSIFNGPNQDQI